jgi:hypothetical protein
MPTRWPLDAFEDMTAHFFARLGLKYALHATDSQPSWQTPSPARLGHQVLSRLQEDRAKPPHLFFSAGTLEITDSN